MSLTCSACSAPFVPEDDWPFELEPTCDCIACSDCGEVFRSDDSENGITVASSDEMAEEHDPGELGKCQACWSAVLEGGADASRR